MADWAKEWRYCRSCYKTEYKHAGEGYCKSCWPEIFKDQQPERKDRNCLTCDKVFKSKGSGNRRCEDCLRKERDSNTFDRAHKVSIRLGH